MGRRSPRWRFMAVVVLAALVMTTVYAVRVVASYRALALGGGPLELGLVAAGYGLLSLLAAVSVGRLVDRRGEATFLVIGAILLAGAAALAVGAQVVALLIVSQLALGLGQLLFAVAAQTFVGRQGDAVSRSAWFGLYGAGGSTGQLVGPVLGAVVVAALARDEGAGRPGVVLGLGLAVAIGLASSLWLAERQERAAARLVTEAPPRTSAWRILRAPGMAVAMLASIAVNLGGDVLIVFLPAYGQAAGIPVEAVGVLLGLRGAAALAVRLLTGSIVGWLGPDRTLLAAVAVPAAGLLLIPFLRAPEALAAVMLAIGAGLGLGQPMTLSWVSTAAPGGSRATAMALRVSGNRLGQIVAPVVLGTVAGPAGVAAVFLVLAGLLGSVAVLLLRSPLPRDAA